MRVEGIHTTWCCPVPRRDRLRQCCHHLSAIQPSARCLTPWFRWTRTLLAVLGRYPSYATRTPRVGFWRGGPYLNPHHIRGLTMPEPFFVALTLTLPRTVLVTEYLIKRSQSANNAQSFSTFGKLCPSKKSSHKESGVLCRTYRMPRTWAVHLRAVLRWILHKHGLKIWTALNWLSTGSNDGFGEHDVELSSSLRRGIPANHIHHLIFETETRYMFCVV
jgi:hypothetical protein